MELNDFSVKLQGIPSSEIARFAQFSQRCPDCKADYRVPCRNPRPGRQVCQSRFIAAIRQLAAVGEEAILAQFAWMDSWEK